MIFDFYLKEIKIEDACGREKNMIISNENNTRITSPNFPGYYPPHQDCTWTIVTTENRRIELKIHIHSINR